MTQEELNKFYTKVSFSGILILYALKLSLEKKIAFDRDHYADTIQAGSSDYFFGFIVACTSFDIVRYNSKEKVITVTYLDPLISQTIKLKAEEMSQNSKHWKEWLERIPKYFQ
jgi:hypothetical protein